MNNCGAQETLPNNNVSPNNCNIPAMPQIIQNEDSSNQANTEVNLAETHRKATRRHLPGMGPPPRPFKKARFAWEIKNYDYTVKKMRQSMPHYLSQASMQNIDNSCISTRRMHNADMYSGDNPFNCSSHQLEPMGNQMGLPCDILPSMNNIDSRGQHPGIVGSFIHSSYPSQYGGMGLIGCQPPCILNSAMMNDQNQGDHLSTDPDAHLLRWHTRRLCRSIFDNTVNRVLENMGFSPLTEQSQGIHPLLVLSLSDEEEREAEELHQRVIDTRVLSAALQQKCPLPHPYHYDPQESATTSDYDSSEDESDFGEEASVNEDVSLEHCNEDNYVHQIHLNPAFHLNPLIAAQFEERRRIPDIDQLQDGVADSQLKICGINHMVRDEIKCNIQGCKESFINKSESISNINELSKGDCDEKEPKVCDEIKPCCDISKRDCKKDHCGILNSKNPDLSESCGIDDHCESKEPTVSCEGKCIPSCPIIMCDQLNKCSDILCYDIAEKVDDNENCILSSSQTHIKGKVEQVIDRDTDSPFENSSVSKDNSNSKDKFCIGPAIHMTVNQAGLGFQKA